MRLNLLTSDITDIARLQHLAGRFRPPVAVILASLSASSIGLATAAKWLGAVLACELRTWFATRPAMSRELSRREMINYILSGAATMPAWATLGVIFWVTPRPEHSSVAVALWVGQLLYTQRFVFQSYLAVLMGNGVMVATMVVVPILYPVLTGREQLLFEIGLLLCVGFTISASLAAYARIRSLAEQNAAIERAAVTDSLTGLPNCSRFATALQTVTASQRAACVLYMDLDRFKQVNDTLGHHAGDAWRRQFAGRLLEVSPPGALAARLGGDEFAVLLEGDDAALDTAETLSRRILDSVRAPFPIANGTAHVGVSIGVALTEPAQTSGEDLMRRADIALYTMKADGRAGFKVFSQDLEAEVRSRAEIEQALRATLATSTGLRLVYQPKVDRTGRITGVEALPRWSMGDRPVSPAVFVPIAEETGLILPIGNWVVRQAVSFAERWPDLSVAVNLSPAQLNDASFAERLLDLLAASPMRPGQLELEVTETALFDTGGPGVSGLNKLRAAGLHVALDDFGTGYSSLRHLHSVSVDRVKIDQSFVAGLGRNAESSAIISAVVQLAHSMGIQVTAEGVETARQRNFLIEIGADELQGFFFSRPLEEADLAAWLRRDLSSLAA